MFIIYKRSILQFYNIHSYFFFLLLARLYMNILNPYQRKWMLKIIVIYRIILDFSALKNNEKRLKYFIFNIINSIVLIRNVLQNRWKNQEEWKVLSFMFAFIVFQFWFNLCAISNERKCPFRKFQYKRLYVITDI